MTIGINKFQKTCLLCNKSFFGQKENTKYCSRHCSVKAQHQLQRTGVFKHRTVLCKICNTEFERTERSTKYCSSTCNEKERAWQQQVAKRKYSDEKGKRISLKRKERRRYWLNKYKLAKKCSVCNFDESPYALEFAHLSQDDKCANVSTLMAAPIKKLFEEIRRCKVLCTNHHRIETVTNKHMKYRRNYNNV